MDAFGQRRVLPGIELPETRTENGHGAPTHGKSGFMRGRVDTTGQPTDDGQPAPSKLSGEVPRLLQPVERRPARPDNADARGSPSVQGSPSVRGSPSVQGSLLPAPAFLRPPTRARRDGPIPGPGPLLKKHKGHLVERSEPFWITARSGDQQSNVLGARTLELASGLCGGRRAKQPAENRRTDTVNLGQASPRLRQHGGRAPKDVDQTPTEAGLKQSSEMDMKYGNQLIVARQRAAAGSPLGTGTRGSLRGWPFRIRKRRGSSGHDSEVLRRKREKCR